jgi:monoamine oxidase
MPLPLTRRHFMRRLGLAAGAAMGSALLDDVRAMAQPARPLRVVVLGAGLAGLCAAYELERRGHTVVLLEAEKQASVNSSMPIRSLIGHAPP